MRVARLVLGLVAALLVVAPAARAAELPGPGSGPVAADARPPGFHTDATQAIAAARAAPAVQAQLRRRPDLHAVASVWEQRRWAVVFTDRDDVPRAEAAVSSYGAVGEVWTGLNASSYLTRDGLDPVFRKPWVWAPFALLFLVPFVDPRRLRRLLHLDLAALLSFGASCVLLDRGHATAAVLLFYPPLLYLLARCLVAGLRPRVRRGALVPLLPTAALAVGVVALFGARVALNVHSPQVMDIGASSVIGADRILHREALYVDNDGHGDTYGPFNYVAYAPFVLAFPFDGGLEHLPAAHAAAIAFDLLTLVGLFLLGLRLRAGPEGRRLGLALAWAWAACPFTLLGVMDSVNDGLVALLMVWMLVAFASPAARGALLGLATAAKFFPGALLLLVARGRGGEGRKAWLTTAATCLGVVVFSLVVYLPAGGPRELWNCTLGYQLTRPPDLSLWTLADGAGWLKTVVLASAIALAVVVAVLPGRRTVGQVAALAGAVTIAPQLAAGHWFYFYVIWFAPLVLVGLFAEHRDAPRHSAGASSAGADADSDAAARLEAWASWSGMNVPVPSHQAQVT